VPSYCRGLVVDSSGNIYVAATETRSALKITPQGKKPPFSRQQAWTPTGVAIFMEKCVLEWHDVNRVKILKYVVWIQGCRDRLDGKVITLATVSGKINNDIN
jgi:hypothetical protein